MLALGLYFLLTILGSAVGLTISDRVAPASLETGALIWTCLTACAALFVGGLVTSLFTVGENKVEAALYGIIMWALLFALVLVLGAVGVRGGFHAMVSATSTAQTAAPPSWVKGAREAGVPAEKIEAWRRAAGDTPAQTSPDPEQQKAASAAVTRTSWYAFAGMWISMMAAAAGALVGAGPTFRIVAAALPGRRVMAA
jgi:hypothetical protein